MKNKYEAMFVLRNDLSKEEKTNLINQIKETINKYKGEISSFEIWQENRLLAYPIKKQRRADFYLAYFSASPEALSSIRETYRINENILRYLILCLEREK
ncbi:MAG: 30S ribosomal protein S6 [Candidatus Omnitrophica bacterium]|nr:30S ribosomal protein S6 [Candidatus Omnitrophota bacterium]